MDYSETTIGVVNKVGKALLEAYPGKAFTFEPGAGMLKNCFTAKLIEPVTGPSVEDYNKSEYKGD